jgi:predicted RNA binding protein YcfA (HicA-like mRNA interferase family)
MGGRTSPSPPLQGGCWGQLRGLVKRTICCVLIHNIGMHDVTAREAISRLRREGWEERPGKGSHLIFKKPGKRVVVANHSGDIPTGTLRAICEQAEWEYPPSR